MAEVFGGFVAGYSMALITTPLLALLLLRLRAGGGILAYLLPTGANVVAVSVLLHGAMTILLTGLGLILGLILLAMSDAGGALGSLNAPYTLFVAAIILAVTAPAVVLAGRLRRFIVAYALIALAVYGWLLPYLADWSSFG